MGQKHRHSLVGFSAQGLKRLQPSVVWGCRLQRGTGSYSSLMKLLAELISLQLYGSWKLISPRPAWEKQCICCFQSLTSWPLLKTPPDQVSSTHNKLPFIQLKANWLGILIMSGKCLRSSPNMGWSSCRPSLHSRSGGYTRVQGTEAHLKSSAYHMHTWSTSSSEYELYLWVPFWIVFQMVLRFNFDCHFEHFMKVTNV